MKKLRAKTFALKPDIPFRSGTISARCQKVWLELLTHLYESGRGAEVFDLMLWDVRDDGTVRVTFRSSDVVEEAQLGNVPEAIFFVEGIRRESRQAKSVAQRKKSIAEFHEWIELAIVESFLSEPIEIEYSYFNVGEQPFSVVTTAQDIGLQSSHLKRLLSDFGGLNDKEIKRKQQCLKDGRDFKAGTRQRTRVVSVKRKSSSPRMKTKRLKTFGRGWKRFYFDDGQTRRFWYLHTRGEDQTIVQGTTGAGGSVRRKSYSSPKEARDHGARLCQRKLDAGFIAYGPEELRYGRKNRRAIKLIRQSLANYEQGSEHGIPEEFRRYLLEVNGGSPEPDWITLPGHPVYQKVQVGRILGFKPGQWVDDIHYYVRSTSLPEGHVPLASGLHLFTVDQLGAVHFWDDRQLQPGDVADDHRVHYDRIESFVVASSLDEFLTRIAKFPRDTQLEVQHQTPDEKRDGFSKRFEDAQAAAAKKPLRRFYFDDGKLRKFWYIHMQETSHTTRYARFGSRPGETKKRFDSKQAAAASASKLIRQKLKKGYLEVLPEALSITRPPGLKLATESAIRRLEKQLGTKLPDDYRRFLIVQNGGRPEPGFIRIPGVSYIDNVDAGFLYGLYPDARPGESLSWGIEVNGAVLPKGHLPIAYGSDIFTLALGKHYGCIYFWNHESDDVNDRTGAFRVSAGHLLANSFDEYLTRIAMFRAAAS
ncbi:WGR domain-containing protein [Roseiconus nitratireducens]|uniref:WGR domain-containing protein n=1 Tax=Roseiconus nitratireducens TaxID=2605748 RepID=A0A5M6D3L3_9BACT|nr:SMI1/KNR4 family protein [Roseiconus nitratireducens]KAA5539775.1 WGR domain-containing protein [Roseiconus nitratireducens]